MDQCSYRHDIPSALQATSPNRPGHDLAVGINLNPSQRKCSPASGSMISVPRPKAQTHHRHADRPPLVRVTNSYRTPAQSGRGLHCRESVSQSAHSLPGGRCLARASPSSSAVAQATLASSRSRGGLSPTPLAKPLALHRYDIIDGSRPSNGSRRCTRSCSGAQVCRHLARVFHVSSTMVAQHG